MDTKITMDHISLGRRLVACKHFRPMRGMRDVQGRSWDDSLLWRWNSAIDVPDLRDPATVGCLFAMVREAWGDPTLCTRFADGVWNGGYSTEAEALVVALEAAP